MYFKQCNQCGKSWGARKPNPIECPYCKRVDWAEPKKGKRAIHLSEVREIPAAEMEALPKLAGPSIMAEGFPVTIPAPEPPEAVGTVKPQGKLRKAGSTAASLAKPQWFSSSKCLHGWQNSFVCEQNGGGCSR